MDFKFKGKAWVGNIYQKFEAMCQEVDDFVSEDTVKYVENQVQNVGENVKRFCSDVVDLLPPLNDQSKCVEKEVSQTQNEAIGTFIRSMLGIEGKSSCVDTEISLVTQDPVDPLKDCHYSSVSDFCHVKQCGPLPAEDPYEEKECHLSAPGDDDAFVSENSGPYTEENTRKEEQYHSKDISYHPDKNFSGESIFTEFSDKTHKVAIPSDDSPNTSTHEEEFKDSQKEERPCNRFLVNLDCESNASSVLHSSEQAFSVVSYENKTTETSLISSRSSLPAESYNLSGFYHEAETICCNPSGTTGCISNLSSALSSAEFFSNVAFDDKFSQTRLDFSTSFLPFVSNDDTDFNIGDPSMETIDLSDRLKLDESCVIVDDKLLHPASRHARKFRSYKKIIQDAFASKRRLKKEYKQLAIYYGDLDMETSLQAEQSHLRPSSTKSIKSKSPVTDDLCDSEWEVL